MKVKLWGVRGSVPTPLTNDEYQNRINKILLHAFKKKISSAQDLPSFLENLPAELRSITGGNTTCVEVITEDNDRYILDGGTGIRELGYKMMEGDAGKGNDDIKIFFTHTHWDHVQGIPFFIPIYIPGNKIHFYSPIQDLEERLALQMEGRFFPAEFRSTASVKNFTVLKNGEPLNFNNDLLVDFLPVQHPGGSNAYRFRQNGKTFIFATDAEFTGEVLEHQNSAYDSFFQNADVLIIDSQYTLDDSFLKFDWGHTSYTMAVNCGAKWNIKKLILTHHEPSYLDDKLQENFEKALIHKDQLGSRLPEIYLAREGLEITV